MNVKTEVSKDTYISHFEGKVKRLQERIKKEFQTLSYYEMNGLMNTVKYYKGLIQFAKSGKQQTFIIYK